MNIGNIELRIEHELLIVLLQNYFMISGISQLLYTRTSRRFLACRLHPEMENKILFLTSKVG